MIAPWMVIADLVFSVFEWALKLFPWAKPPFGRAKNETRVKSEGDCSFPAHALTFYSCPIFRSTRTQITERLVLTWSWLKRQTLKGLWRCKVPTFRMLLLPKPLDGTVFPAPSFVSPVGKAATSFVFRIYPGAMSSDICSLIGINKKMLLFLYGVICCRQSKFPIQNSCCSSSTSEVHSCFQKRKWH